MTPSPPHFDPAMERLRAEIELVLARLAASSRALEERGVAMLLAETPLADLEYGAASAAHRRLRRRLHDAQAALGSLILERESLVEVGTG